MNAVADKLREARALIERGWTQGAWARLPGGSSTLESDSKAVCWCASGAIFLAKGVTLPALELFSKAAGCENIPTWNDEEGRTQAEVLAAFDKAIELAEAGQ